MEIDKIDGNNLEQYYRRKDYGTKDNSYAFCYKADR